jgi:hypothetical protein
MGSHPTHQGVITTISQLCNSSITEFEAILQVQVESDQAARREMERAKERAWFTEEAAKKAGEEAAKLVADLAATERERLAATDSNVLHSYHTSVWSDPQDTGDPEDDVDEQEEEEDDGNDSAADDVCLYCHLVYSTLTKRYYYFRGLVRSPSASWRGRPAANFCRGNTRW